MGELITIEGRISIEAALQAQVRDVQVVYVREDKSPKKVWRLLRSAENTNTPVQFIPAKQIDALAQGHSHGGIIAQATPRHFATLDQLLPTDHPACIMMLDGVEDPYNLGQAVRTMYALGVDGLVVSPRDWYSSEATILRASAGAFDLLPIAVADSAENVADFYRQQNLAIACTTNKNATSLYDSDLTKPLFLLIGGAKRGITRSFLSRADLRLKIPYARPFSNSLGTVAAASVISAEIMRQRA